jgi:hypothetical protein
MAFRFKSMGYKMKPSSLRSPLKVGGPEDEKKTATANAVEDVISEGPRKTSSTVTTDTSSDYNPTTIKKGEDPKTGYYNPFETLAKVILTPNTERAKQRVKERQEKRINKLEAKGASTKKIEKVKTRQADVRKQRGFDK